MAIDQKILNKSMQDKKIKIENRLDEYKKSLSNQINECQYSTDFENIAATAVRYASVIAKLEGELQQLEDLMMYVD